MSFPSYIFNSLPIGLLLVFIPLFYVINIRQAHRFCENNLPNQVTNVIKFLTPKPSELVCIFVIHSYSLLLSITIYSLMINFIIMLFFWLF